MRARAIAHPNVALIKYWGKRAAADNLPATGSLSIVLGGLATDTTVAFDAALATDVVLLNGGDDPAAAQRVTACLDELRQLAGVKLRARVETRNDFPTGAGLASSASGFAALVVAGAAALGLRLPAARLADITRRGSGSAPRSLHGGFVTLRNAGDQVNCEPLAAAADWPLTVVVAITTSGPKATGSREGMVISQRTSPYYPAWVATHEADLGEGVAAVEARDFQRLAAVAEHNCLKMHAVMLSSVPPLIYWNPATLACIQRIRELRAGGVPVFFTVDAGPQVKAVCAPGYGPAVARELQALPGVLDVLESPLGEAARTVPMADADADAVKAVR